MTKIRLKMVLTLGVLAVLLTVSVAGSSLGISFTFGAKSSTAPPKITANATNVMRFYPYHHHTAPFHPPWRIVTPTPTPTPTTEPTATPTPSITPPASITPPPTPTARIPTQINVHVIPFSSTKGYMSGVSFGVTAKGGTIICNNGFVVEGFVDGSYIGQAKVTDSGACAQSMILDIPTSNLALGNHIVIITFVGNAQYAPSATTCNLFVVA